MTKTRAHVLSSLSAMLLFLGLQSIVQTIVFLWLFHGLVLSPYAFFPTEAGDVFAKLRYAGGSWLEWAPSLPDHFRPPSVHAQLVYCWQIVPLALALALPLATAGGMLGAVVQRRGKPSIHVYLGLWLGFALVVHVIDVLPALRVGEITSARELIRRAYGPIVNGGVVAIAIAMASGALAFRLLPLIERSVIGRVLGLGSILALAFGALVFKSVSATTDPPPNQPVGVTAMPTPYNVVLISLDSLRADHVGVYGYDVETTPNLDRLATHGIRFSRATSTSSWTLPTHLTMFTGRYELNHGVIGDTLVLSRAVPTLGEILKANGYLTGAFVSGPYLGGHYGYARGMDAYLDLSAGHEKRHDAGSMVLAPAVTEHALAWLDVNSQSPFFLFLHYFDIHYDYVPPPPYDTMFDPSYSGSIDGRRFLERPDIDADMNPRDLQHILALYDGEIRFTDDQVGRVLTKLDDLGISDDTLVLIVSDHGDEFFEHGKKGHQQTLYREVLDIVFIVRMPHGLYAGRKIDVPVSLIDVMPTILDVLGIPIPIGVDGKSLRQLLAQPASFARESVYAELYYKGALNVQVARRTADSKVIQHFNRITHPRRPSLEYYDLNSDPTERQNAARFRPAELMSALDAMARSLEERWRVRRARADTTHEEDLRITLDEETLRRLESLGYVED